MDGQRFDQIARSLATATSRRRVLRGLAAGAAGAVAGAVGLRRAGAQSCPGYGRVCRPGDLCAAGAACRCYRNGHCRCLCPEGASFVDGACTCPQACPAGEACGIAFDAETGQTRAGCCVPPGGAIPECDFTLCCDADPDACGWTFACEVVEQQARCCTVSEGAPCPVGDECCQNLGLACVDGRCRFTDAAAAAATGEVRVVRGP